MYRRKVLKDSSADTAVLFLSKNDGNFLYALVFGIKNTFFLNSLFELCLKIS